MSKRKILLAALLALPLFSGGCAPPEPETPKQPEREIIIASHHSTRAEESANAPWLGCLGRSFKLPRGVTQFRYGGVALYLSRFYEYTDLFDKAESCESLVLNYATSDAPQGTGYPWYHVAMFSYKNQRSVELIRKLEQRDKDFSRKRATEDASGQLTFKSGTECYRVYFADKKVIFFFFQGRPSCEEDPELFAAALRVKECLLGHDQSPAP